MGLIPTGVSLISRSILARATRKKREAAQPKQDQDVTAQESEINALKAQNADLNGRLESLEGLLNQPKTGDIKIAQLDFKEEMK